jgi:hypothetical protein
MKSNATDSQIGLSYNVSTKARAHCITMIHIVVHIIHFLNFEDCSSVLSAKSNFKTNIIKNKVAITKNTFFKSFAKFTIAY